MIAIISIIFIASLKKFNLFGQARSLLEGMKEKVVWLANWIDASIAEISPDTKFERKPYYAYRFYEEEWIRNVRHLIFLDFCAVCCCIEHLESG